MIFCRALRLNCLQFNRITVDFFLFFVFLGARPQKNKKKEKKGEKNHDSMGKEEQNGPFMWLFRSSVILARGRAPKIFLRKKKKEKINCRFLRSRKFLISSKPSLSKKEN
nr:hypothetical protein [Trentepohlia sp. YN1317]